MSGEHSPVDLPEVFRLEDLTIPIPCEVPWDAMAGNDRRRFCGTCKLHVCRLAGMSRRDAEELIRSRNGDVCVQLYRRPDGTVVTRSCGEVLARAAKRARIAVLAVIGLLVAGAATVASRVMDLGGFNSHRAWQDGPLATIEPLVPDELQPAAPPMMIAGRICIVPTPAPAPIEDPAADE